jgi:surface protein
MSMVQMFSFASSFNGNLSFWDTSKVINMSYMFEFASSFQVLVVVSGPEFRFSGPEPEFPVFLDPKFRVNSVKKPGIPGFFRIPPKFPVASDRNRNPEKTTKFQGVGLEHWDISKVRKTVGMFGYASALTADLSTWNTSGVVSMSSMFYFGSSFDGSNLSFWDTSKVEDMSYMFALASSFHGNRLDFWDVRHVKNMEYMFLGASGLVACTVVTVEYIQCNKHVHNVCYSVIF